jgi:hypothetical protein
LKSGAALSQEPLVQKVSLQRLTACDQTVVGVGQGENRKERESCFASRAEAATNPNPVVTFVMSLFAPSTMANDRIAQTLGTEANNQFATSAAQSKSGLHSFPESGIK